MGTTEVNFGVSREGREMGESIFSGGGGGERFLDPQFHPWLKLNRLVVTLRSFVLVLNNTEPFSIDAERHTGLV